MQAEKTQDEVQAQQAAEIAVLRTDKAHMTARLEALYAEKAALGRELDLCRAKCEDLTRSLGHVTRANGDLANERHRLAERVAQLEAEVAEVRRTQSARTLADTYARKWRVRAADVVEVLPAVPQATAPTAVTREMAVEHMRRGGVIAFDSGMSQRRIHSGECQKRVKSALVWSEWFRSSESEMDDLPGCYTLLPIEAQQDEVT